MASKSQGRPPSRVERPGSRLDGPAHKGNLHANADTMRHELDALRSQNARLKKELEHTKLHMKDEQSQAQSEKRTKTPNPQGRPDDATKKLHSNPELERIKFEMTQAQKTNRELTEKIVLLKKQCDAVEARLQESKKSNTADQTEIKILRQKLKIVESERDKLVKKQEGTGDMRMKVLAAEDKRKEDLQERNKQLVDLQKQLAAEKRKTQSIEMRLAEAQAKSSKDPRYVKANRQEVDQRIVENQAEANEAMATCIALEEELTSTREAHASQLELLYAALQQTAREYGRLSQTSVPKTLHSETKLECLGLRMRLSRMERKLANSEDQAAELIRLIRYYKQQSELMTSQLEDMDAHNLLLSDSGWMPDQTVFHSDRRELGELLSILDEFEGEKRIFDRNLTKVLLDRSRNLVKLGNLRYTELLQSHADMENDLVQEYESHVTAVNGLESALAMARDERASLELQKQQLEQQAIEQASSLTATQAELQLRNDAVMAMEKNSNIVQSQKDTLLKREREAVQRLSSTVQQQRMAHEALEADIVRLTAELKEFDQYREAYGSLLHEVQDLVARNALAEDEAERLSLINAEILGHSNPTQRISYVDKIRRELAETKQKLIVSARERETVLDENQALQDELHNYKSVPYNSRPATSLTRVTRLPLAPRIQNGVLDSPDKQHDEGVSNLLDATLPNITTFDADVTWC